MRAMVAAIALFASAASVWAEPPADAVRRKDAGNQHLKLREYDAARDQYLAALKLAPEYSDVHYNLGVLYFFRLGDYPRALYHLVRYARLKPDASDLGQVQSLTAQAMEKIEDAEREAYAETLRSGTAEALEAFRRAHPQSPYAEDAKGKLGLLAEYDKEVRRREQNTREAYDRAVARATPGAMDEFLQTYPGAPQSAEATRLRDLWTAQRAADEQAFLAALDAGTAAALAGFLEERPQSAYASEAQKQLQQLRDAEEAYRIATEARSIPALERFLAGYGSSRQAAEAQTLLETLRAEQTAATAATAARAAAEQAWGDAAAADSIAAYQRFVTGHPDHAKAREARDRIAALEQEAEAAQLRAEADRVWEAVEGENRAAAYRDFAVAYPGHPNTAEAGRRAAALEEAAATAALEAQARAAAEAARTAANRAWEETARTDTVAAYQGFVAAYPEHPEAGTARDRIAALQREAQEAQRREARLEADRAWKEADRTATVVAYQAFLATHPDHPKADQARREIERLRGEAGEAAAREAADRAWDTARRADTLAAYAGFLAAYPDHPKAGTARREIADREKQAAAQKADEAWRTAAAANTVTAYREFLASYPDHGQAGKAERAIRKLEEQADEKAKTAAREAAEQAWRNAERTDSVAAYQDFVAAHPDHAWAARAYDRIATLENQAAATAAAEASLAAAARAWAAAEGRDTATGYEEFYRAWPDHAQADEARRRAAAMTAAATQTPVAAPPAPEQPAADAATAAWAEARDTDTVAAYEGFLSRHPDAEEAAAARSRLAELKEAALQSSEDSQLSRSKRKALNRYRRMLITE
ncbi:MAG: tetratricopeptide repeat protein [Deferrisomatales bacterium]|nr:tetratricopeptide repeat protein [Deferrisomatales bacterium]